MSLNWEKYVGEKKKSIEAWHLCLDTDFVYGYLVQKIYNKKSILENFQIFKQLCNQNSKIFY